MDTHSLNISHVKKSGSSWLQIAITQLRSARLSSSVLSFISHGSAFPFPLLLFVSIKYSLVFFYISDLCFLAYFNVLYSFSSSSSTGFLLWNVLLLWWLFLLFLLLYHLLFYIGFLTNPFWWIFLKLNFVYPSDLW